MTRHTFDFILSHPGRPYFIASLCYIGVIFFLSSLPDSSLSPGWFTQKTVFWSLGHIPLYGILAILLCLSRISGWKVLSLSLCVALLDELHQAAVPGRTASALDILLDATGIVSALWVCRVRSNKMLRDRL